MSADPFHLERFVSAQDACIAQVLAELRGGQKQTHWMWFVFPQLDGLGRSETAKHYGIKTRAEAEAFLAHPVLGPRLMQCCEALLSVDGRSAHEIMGSPDDLKLHSSMTLFAQLADPGSFYHRVLDRFFAGRPDARTLALLTSLLGH